MRITLMPLLAISLIACSAADPLTPTLDAGDASAPQDAASSPDVATPEASPPDAATAPQDAGRDAAPVERRGPEASSEIASQRIYSFAECLDSERPISVRCEQDTGLAVDGTRLVESVQPSGGECRWTNKLLGDNQGRTAKVVGRAYVTCVAR